MEWVMIVPSSADRKFDRIGCRGRFVVDDFVLWRRQAALYFPKLH